MMTRFKSLPREMDFPVRIRDLWIRTKKTRWLFRGDKLWDVFGELKLWSMF